MKNVFWMLSLVSVFLFAQETQNNDKEEMEKKYGGFGKSDRFHLQIFNDVWMNLPDSGTYSWYNPGLNLNLFQEFKFGSSNFSFAVGAGISAHNFRFQAEMLKDSNDYITFHPFAEKKDKYKLVLSYVDLPIEFRYRTKGENIFRVYVGGKIGYMMSNHIKMVDEGLKTKTYNISNLLKYRYGLTLTVGYKLINIYAYYSLSHLFEKNKGPEMYPISVGISFIPF
jgi:hypothetical protein